MTHTPQEVAAHAVDDEIITAGVFQARGATLKVMMGAGAGSSVGDLVGGGSATRSASASVRSPATLRAARTECSAGSSP